MCSRQTHVNEELTFHKRVELPDDKQMLILLASNVHIVVYNVTLAY